MLISLLRDTNNAKSGRKKVGYNICVIKQTDVKNSSTFFRPWLPLKKMPTTVVSLPTIITIIGVIWGELGCA